MTLILAQTSHFRPWSLIKASESDSINQYMLQSRKCPVCASLERAFDKLETVTCHLGNLLMLFDNKEIECCGMSAYGPCMAERGRSQSISCYVLESKRESFW